MPSEEKYFKNVRMIPSKYNYQLKTQTPENPALSHHSLKSFLPDDVKYFKMENVSTSPILN